MKYPFALQVEQLSVTYDKTPVLWDITFHVPAGQLIGIVGPNGAGKSTLIKSILGLVQPLSGKITLLGKTLNELKPKVAYIPQRESVDWEFPITVQELVLMGRYGALGLFKRPQLADHQAVAHYLELVGLTEYKDRQINQLSGGQQQRAFLARALAQEAEIYFLDEPFIGIDAATEAMMVQLLKKMAQEGKTILIVHHDLNSVESLFSWLILLNLRLVAAGKVATVFTPHYLKQAYGKSFALLDQAAKLAEQKNVELM